MATEQQIAANRANALHSTGPKTETGKSASSVNATRHSLTAKGLIILPGQESDFEQLESGLRATLIPNGPLQEVLFKRIVECAWKLERCRLAEGTLMRNSRHPEADPMIVVNLEKDYANVQKYAREAENSMYKAMDRLSKLQTEGRFRDEAFPLTRAQREHEELFEKTPHALSEVCNVAQVTNTVTNQRRTEAKTNGINMDTELKALAGLHPLEYSRRFQIEAIPEELAGAELPQTLSAAA